MKNVDFDFVQTEDTKDRIIIFYVKQNMQTYISRAC